MLPGPAAPQTPMDRILFALVFGVFGGPAAPQETPAPAHPVLQPAAARSAPAAEPAAVQHVVPNRDPSVAAAEARSLAQPPVSGAEAAAGRATVRHEKQPLENGRIRHEFTFSDGTSVTFTDRPKGRRDTADRARVLVFSGTHKAEDEPAATFEAAGKTAGLSPEAVQALRYVSRHEGGFDAINTWDSARFSWGFIQFAGGYGLRPALATFKERSPELFRRLLGAYGVDVVPGEDGPLPVYVSPSGRVLRGKDAEQEYGDDPLVIALFIRAGRVPEVKQRQVEAAIRDYAAPALEASYQGIRLSSVLRSPQALAMLIDRKVHEGNVGRLEWALEHAWVLSNAPNPVTWARLERQVLDLAVQDAEARSSIRELADTAADTLLRAAAAARGGQMALVPNGPSLGAARAAMEQALSEANYRMVVSYRRDALRDGLAQVLATTDPSAVAACDGGECAGRLEAAAEKIRGLVSRMRYDYAIRDRLRGIRGSELPGPQ